MLHCHLYLNPTPVAGGSEVFKPEKKKKKGALISANFTTTQKKKRPPLSVCDPESTRSFEQDKLADRAAALEGCVVKGKRRGRGPQVGTLFVIFFFF